MNNYIMTYSNNATWGSTNTIIFKTAMNIDAFDKPENVKKLLKAYGEEFDAEYIVDEKLYYFRHADDIDINFEELGDE